MNLADLIVRSVRDELRRGGSRAHAQGLQRFFKEPVQAHGWRTAALRRRAVDWRREILASGGEDLLFAVAEKLFPGPALEETALGTVLLERAVEHFGEREFRRLERWLGSIRHWGACDALAGTLIGPMMLMDRSRVGRVYVWARSKNRWYRRMAAVALVPAARRGLYVQEILRVADRLLSDQDDMVQKGLGWLLKELGEKQPRRQLSYLRRVRQRAPRLVLRIACEKLPPRTRQRILG